MNETLTLNSARVPPQPSAATSPLDLRRAGETRRRYQFFRGGARGVGGCAQDRGDTAFLAWDVDGGGGVGAAGTSLRCSTD